MHLIHFSNIIETINTQYKISFISFRTTTKLQAIENNVAANIKLDVKNTIIRIRCGVVVINKILSKALGRSIIILPHVCITRNYGSIVHKL